jgi:two-component system chemotaxis response regulator CheY
MATDVMTETMLACLPRVLIVEDEDAVGEIIVDILSDAGFAVRRARNGREGLAVLGQWLPRVILLDLMMPVMDGWTFRAEQRRLSGPEAEVPVIVLSGARDVRMRAGELQAVQAISKPFDLDEVVGAVERWSQPTRE